MDKIYYIAYRNPMLYKYAEDSKKSDTKSDTSKSKDTKPSGASTEKKYTKQEFDSILANYASTQLGGKPVGSEAIYDAELKKRRRDMNILDSRTHNAYLRATGYNPKLVFGGALLGYGAGALASKLLGFETSGAWYDASHRNRWFGGPSGAPGSGSKWHIPTSIADAVSMLVGNDDKTSKEDEEKFFKPLADIDSKLSAGERKYLLDQASVHGYAVSGKETVDLDGTPCIEVTFADGSTAKISSSADPSSGKYVYKQHLEPYKNPYRWVGYGLRGLGFLAGGAIPYLASKSVELPYDASTYVYNRYVR